MSRLTIILIALGLLAVAAFGVRLAYQAGWPHINQPKITAGVLTSADRNDWEKAGAKVTDVLKKRFPAGSAVANVLIALRAQGFEPLRQCPEPTLHKVEGQESTATPGQDRYACSQNWDPEHALRYTWSRTPCVQELVVWWTDDSNGRLTSIEGQYACNPAAD